MKWNALCISWLFVLVITQQIFLQRFSTLAIDYLYNFFFPFKNNMKYFNQDYKVESEWTSLMGEVEKSSRYWNCAYQLKYSMEEILFVKIWLRNCRSQEINLFIFPLYMFHIATNVKVWIENYGSISSTIVYYATPTS